MPLDPPPSTLSAADFVGRYGGIYEHSPWVAEGVAASGLSTADDAAARLAARMAAVVEAAAPKAKLALLRAHPELAGKLAVAGKLTAESTGEQASAGLDRCTPDEFDRFSRLNAAYTEKFGFPFIVAVRGLTRSAILDAFAIRLDNDRESELRTALAEVHKIARLRLAAMEAGA